MDDLIIEGTNSLPTVVFKENGDLKISGRALPENAIKFFAPLLAWAREFQAEQVNLEVNLDYFNTSVSKQLLDFFREIDKNPVHKVIRIKWMYEDGDEEMLESGELYKELLPRFEFVFHKYAELTR